MLLNVVIQQTLSVNYSITHVNQLTTSFSCSYYTPVYAVDKLHGEISCVKLCSENTGCLHFQQRDSSTDSCQLCVVQGFVDSKLMTSQFTSYDITKNVYEKAAAILFYNDKCNWNQAKDKCTQKGGNLLSIETNLKKESVLNLFMSLGKCIISHSWRYVTCKSKTTVTVKV